MQIGETAPEGVYDITCLGKGAQGRMRFTDRGYGTGSSKPDAGLAKRRTALSAAFGAFLKTRGIPQAFEELENQNSVICRKCEVKIPMMVRISGDKPMPEVLADEGSSLADATVTCAVTIAEQVQAALNSILKKHGLFVAALNLRFGFAGEIVLASLLNFDNVEVRFAGGTFSGKMTNDHRLVEILLAETPSRKAA